MSAKDKIILQDFHLHLLHKAAISRFLQMVLQVERAADSGVSDHGGEDFRAVDLLTLPPAMPLCLCLCLCPCDLHCLNRWVDIDKVEEDEG